MTSENEDQCSLATPIKGANEAHKWSKISYTRDFLLSFSELETCKRLPSGVDPSILSEFQEASHSIPEWRRTPGSLSLPKHGEHGSTPTRVDYTRGGHDRNAWQGSGFGLGHGKWDSRFGLNDKDGDQQFDCESISQDSGRHYGNQSRLAWQSTEHDGLLGSGGFPRPSGNTGGALSPKVRGSAQYHLNRSTEPYHPPRPYKAGNYSRRGTTDSCNDETFGSTECSNQDRAEEERMRRTSFELMRKDQQRALQEKQKHIPNKQREQLNMDIAANLEKSEDEKNLQSQSSRRSEDLAVPDSQNDHIKCVLPTQAPAARPLVPPGFKSSILEKNLGLKPLVPSSESADGKSGFVESHLNMNATAIKSAIEVESDLSPFMGPIEKNVIPLLSGLEISNSAVGSEIPYEKKSGLQDANEGWVDGTVTVEEERSSSVLEKLFGNAWAVNDGGFPGFIEHQSILADEDTWHPIQSRSSKFAHWFLDEEKKSADYDQSSSKANDLLSLFVNNEKDASQVSSVSEKGVENIPPTFPVENKHISQKLITTDATSTTVGITETFHHSDKSSMRHGVLTCEDLEESILAEVMETSVGLQHPLQGPWSALEVKADQQSVDVDDRASQHLLSLLLKGSGPRDQAPSVNNQEMGPSGVGELISIGEVGPSASGMKADTIQNPEHVLTLETLFGTAFMKELQSVEAPVSAQRGLAGGAVRTDALDPLGLPFPVVNDGLSPLGASESGPSRTIHEGHDITASARNREENSETIRGNWLGFDDPETKGSKLAAVLGFEVNRPEGAVGTRLPEEESLISVGKPMNMETSKFVIPVGLARKPEDLLSSNTQIEMTDKLAALNAILREEKPILPGMDCQASLPHDPYIPVESKFLYQNLLGGPCPKLPHAVNQPRHMYQQPEHHPIRNHQLKFMAQESLRHEPHHPFPPNVFHHPLHNSGALRFSPPHHSLLQQQHFPVPNNLPPLHLLQALPRGMSLSHPTNHVGSYAPELQNPMQGFPFNHRPLNYGGLGMAMPGSGDVGGGGGNHPEALERLIEMELRANSNKKLAAAPGINGPHELDIPGFRYR